jgi:hypothetical protein
MGVEVQPVAAAIDGWPHALCTWSHEGAWYGLPIWPARFVQVYE